MLKAHYYIPMTEEDPGVYNLMDYKPAAPTGRGRCGAPYPH